MVFNNNPLLKNSYAVQNILNKEVSFVLIAVFLSFIVSFKNSHSECNRNPVQVDAVSGAEKKYQLMLFESIKTFGM